MSNLSHCKIRSKRSMKNFFLTLCLLLTVKFFAFGQVYGNEWINYSPSKNKKDEKSTEHIFFVDLG